MLKRDVLTALRSLPKDEAFNAEADAAEVGGFRVWRLRNYAPPGSNRRYAWKWIYYGSHPEFRAHDRGGPTSTKFGGEDSMHSFADIVVRLNRRLNSKDG
jgi:hypothetical protein